MIKIEHLCKSFGENTVFEDLCIEIKDGEFVIFAGVSGCGKTTLLHMIGGIEKIDSGNIIVDGLDISKEKRLNGYFKEKIGFLFQNFALVEQKSIQKNLEMVQKSARSSISIQEALERVGLAGKENICVYKLSGGEQQRVALARLMVKKCDIILADEPTGSLDSKNADSVMQFLHQLNDEGKTIIMVTHDEGIIKKEKRVIHL